MLELDGDPEVDVCTEAVVADVVAKLVVDPPNPSLSPQPKIDKALMVESSHRSGNPRRFGIAPHLSIRSCHASIPSQRDDALAAMNRSNATKTSQTFCAWGANNWWQITRGATRSWEAEQAAQAEQAA